MASIILLLLLNSINFIKEGKKKKEEGKPGVELDKETDKPLGLERRLKVFSLKVKVRETISENLPFHMNSKLSMVKMIIN